MTIDKEQAQIIAQWWTEQFDAPNKRDAGDATVEAGFVLFQKPATPPTEEQKQVFCEVLARLILERQPRSIDFDYDPDELLEQALEESGISYKCLPIKTWFVCSQMKFKVGYGGAVESLTNPPPSRIA